MVGVAEPATDDLIRRAAEGDGPAFGAVYDLHARDVQRLVVGMRLGLGREEVEDAVQETFLRALRDLPRFDRSRSLRGWLLGIARHVAVDRARRGRVRAAGALEGDRLPDPAPARGEAAVERRERAGLVADAMATLSPDHRVALALRHVEGLSMDDLSAALGCSHPTARARLREAAHLLAGELRRRGLAQEVAS